MAKLQATDRWIPSILLILASCGASAVSKTPLPEPTPHPVGDGDPLFVVDTEESLWPDPLQRTWVRLSSLQHLIEGYVARTGKLPDALEDVIPHLIDRQVLARDAWGQMIRFRSLPGDYELVSAGVDGVFGNDDDIVARRASEMPVFRRPTGQTTLVVLHLFQRQVTLYHHRRGSLPAHLDDLVDAGFTPYLGKLDEWGESIAYVRSDGDFELRSAGQDRQLNTGDDIVVRGFDRTLP
jgi:hypothetical protein